MKIAINGFGRIGRAVFKIALEKGLDIIAINDLQGVGDAAYLLKYDSVYGKYAKFVRTKGSDLLVNDKVIKVFTEADPEKLPWKKMGVDVVIESTGVFTTIESASKHIKAGAKKVLISAPCKGPGLVIVPGVNDKSLKENDNVFSIASCTTNCLAPVIKVLNENFKIKKAFMTTVHAYTSSQSLVDGSNIKRRRGRTAGLNIVPTTTGADEAVEKVLPEMKGKLSGVAMRVPVPCGSIIDVVAEVEKKANVENVNKSFKKASEKELKGILEYTEEDIVSSDVIGNSHSSVFDSTFTAVNGNLVKVMAWYDNEYGYSSRMVDVVLMLKKWIK
ncbi:type I glyceraldehyde-3-phosphate dehydrogenase [Candidatus Pacearchaeota archaeon]|nr:type I glyceraldehyde-3-phosphate dehydrogenase [Candidatus Pacearchaeota archaeon]